MEYPNKGRRGISTKKVEPDSGSTFFCGDGQSRTAVQTTSPAAFYTLILPLVVGSGLPEGGPAEAYPLNLGQP